MIITGIEDLGSYFSGSASQWRYARLGDQSMDIAYGGADWVRRSRKCPGPLLLCTGARASVLLPWLERMHSEGDKSMNLTVHVPNKQSSLEPESGADLDSQGSSRASLSAARVSLPVQCRQDSLPLQSEGPGFYLKRVCYCKSTLQRQPCELRSRRFGPERILLRIVTLATATLFCTGISFFPAVTALIAIVIGWSGRPCVHLVSVLAKCRLNEILVAPG